MRLQLLSILFAFPLLALASFGGQTILTNEQLHNMPETYTPATTSQPTLADLLTIESSASIFYSYAREIELSERFSDPNAKITLLVPINKAVMALPRKPHQDPKPSDEGVIISEQEFDILSKRNVERWISAHIIPETLTKIEPKGYRTLLTGKSVAFKQVDSNATPEWAGFVLNDDIHIISMKEALNGVLYVVDGTVKLD